MLILSIWCTRLETTYSSPTLRSSENICRSSGGAQDKGKIGWKKILDRPKKLIATHTKVSPDMFCPQLFLFPFPSPSCHVLSSFVLSCSCYPSLPHPDMFCPHLSSAVPVTLPFPKSGPNGILCVTWICCAHLVTCDAIPTLWNACKQHAMEYHLFPIRVYILYLFVHFSSIILCFLLWCCCQAFDPPIIQV
jgi:hypothetical protein